MNVVAVTDAAGAVVDAALLAAAEHVHRQLRPHLPDDYRRRMEEVFAGGAEMAVAVREGRVLGVTVFRVLEKTLFRFARRTRLASASRRREVERLQRYQHPTRVAQETQA